MTTKIIGLLIGVLFFTSASSQQPNGTPHPVLQVNQDIDNAVVKKNIAMLEKHYAMDFVFTHGTGTVDSKTTWIEAVKRPQTNFVSRKHDSTAVELHDDIAIVTGKLMVTRGDKEKIDSYGLRYVRVFRLKGERWQLISHRTTSEWHD
ncbi:MAG TPA: nuclear transport factor 2 family protein [Ohtaekwangia sp.]|nr:nuclear transport factor 2 family protein [Ohtaekwangia sp.]